ncbi:MAG: VCBS repeat-containing protein [Ignavibacteriae bacterium]|nr:VCBS repeat-containing protein [Ignavibacteriota bacterium]
MKIFAYVFLSVTLLLITPLHAQEYTTDTNTVALWHFNETSGDTVYDASGNGNNGTSTGTTIVDGRFGKARSFNGSAADIIIPYAASLVPTTQITLEGWFRFQSFSEVQELILQGESQPSYVYNLYYNSDNNDDTFYFNLFVGGSYYSVSFGRTAAGLISGNWFHIAGTYDGNSMNLYANGVLAGSATVSGSINSGSGNLYIGRKWDGVYRFGGELDEIRISNIARQPSEFNYPVVKSVTPGQNALNVSKSTNISATFNLSMNTSTLTSSNILVHGSQSGKHTGTITLSGDTSFTFDPATDFKAGEVVTVNLTKNILSATGDSLTNGYDWNFTIQSIGGKVDFTQVALVNVGALPYSITSADLDGDGVLDFAVANANSNYVSVILSDGTGGFVHDSVSLSSDASSSITSGDFDGDGDLDLAAANQNTNTVSILVNNGFGNFTLASTTSVGSSPYSVTAGNFDADGDLDLAVANYGSNNVSVLKNDGTGNYIQTSTTSAGYISRSVVTGDIDRDGDLDLVVGNEESFVSVLMNDGTGTFTQTSKPAVTTKTASVHVADIDGDHDLDILVASWGSYSISVLKNDGTGSFAQSDTIHLSGAPYSVTAGDLDGDGDLDLVAPNSQTNTVSILLNDGNGTFSLTSTPTVGSSPYSQIIGDLDNDGDLDLAVANGGSNTVSILKNVGGVALIKLNNIYVKQFGDGDFKSYPLRTALGIRKGDKIRFEGIVLNDTGGPVANQEIKVYNSFLYDTSKSIQTIYSEQDGKFYYPSANDSISLENASAGFFPFWFETANSNKAIPFCVVVNDESLTVGIINELIKNIVDNEPSVLNIGLDTSSSSPFRDLYLPAEAYPLDDSNLDSKINDSFFEFFSIIYVGPTNEEFLISSDSTSGWLVRGFDLHQSRIDNLLNSLPEKFASAIPLNSSYTGLKQYLVMDYNPLESSNFWWYVGEGILCATTFIPTGVTQAIGPIGCAALKVHLAADAIKTVVTSDIIQEPFGIQGNEELDEGLELVVDIGALLYDAKDLSKHISHWQNPRNFMHGNPYGRINAGAEMVKFISDLGQTKSSTWDYVQMTGSYYRNSMNYYKGSELSDIRFNSSSSNMKHDLNFNFTRANSPTLIFQDVAFDNANSPTALIVNLESTRPIYLEGTITQSIPELRIGNSQFLMQNITSPNSYPFFYKAEIPVGQLPNFDPQNPGSWSEILNATGKSFETLGGSCSGGFCGSTGQTIYLGSAEGSLSLNRSANDDTQYIARLDVLPNAFGGQTAFVSLSSGSPSQYINQKQVFLVSISPVIEVNTSGKSFLVPAQITIWINSANLNHNQLTIYMLNENTLLWEPVQSSVTYSDSVVSTMITTPGRYALMYLNDLADVMEFHAMRRWNIISLPMNPSDSRKSQVYPNAISDAYAYQDGYKIEDSLKVGVGYWLKFDQDQIINITGFPISQETVDVAEGWNIIGSISVPVAVSSLISVPSGIVTSNFFGYSGGYFLADTIYPGKGYWVKSSQAGSIILSGSPPSSQANLIQIVPTSELPPMPPSENLVNTGVPEVYALEQAYPNPFNPLTVIRYQLPVSSKVTLRIYNVLGQEVRALVNEVQDSGYKSVEWNSINDLGYVLSSAVYFYRLDATSISDPTKRFSQVRKMLLLK